MAKLTDPQITPQERADLNDVFQRTHIDRGEAKALGARFGVSPDTVLRWTKPGGAAIPVSAVGRSAGDLPAEWQQRVWLARTLLGEARNTSRHGGKSAEYTSKTKGSLDRVMKRIADYHRHKIDSYRNEAWRRLTARLKKGQWVLEVEYERIPSPDE